MPVRSGGIAMRVFLFALFMALASSAYTQVGEDRPNGQATGEQTPPTRAFEPIRVEIVEDEAKAEARERREAETGRNEKDDLLAQQGMNEATRRMADYSLWQTIFVGAGTVLLVGTLVLTAAANKAATKAANEAGRTNQIMREEARPWVDFELTAFDHLYTTRMHLSNARLNISNVGGSIAFDAKIRSLFYEDGAVGIDDQIKALFDSEGERVPADIDPDGRDRTFTFIPKAVGDYKHFVMFPPHFYEDRRAAVGTVFIGIGIRYTEYERKGAFLTIKHFRISPKEVLIFTSEGKGYEGKTIKIIAHPNRSTYQ
jgi:hypothetical protein